MIFYHVDRTKHLKSNQVIDYKSLPKQCNSEIIEYCNKHFPEGLSNMGLIYTAYRTPEIDDYSKFTSEIFLELYRQNYYPNLPSRFQSICVSDSIEQAMNWFNWLHLDNANIVTFKTENYIRTDSTWRDLISENLSIASTQLFSKNYWSGKEFDKLPRIEYLIKLPVKVIDVLEFKIIHP